MLIAQTKRLFAWDCLEDSPTLRTVKDGLALLPDGQLLEALRAWRGRGRDDYPVHVLWGVTVLTVLLRHPTTAATLGELGRNEGLRRLIGIEHESAVPKAHNMSRFESVLGQPGHLDLLQGMFDTLAQRLGRAVPDLGVNTAGDSTGLSARPEAEPHRDLPAPSGGHKEYTDETGKVVKVVEWFGYKLHQVVDVKHEVALAYAVTDTKTGDNEVIEALVEEAQANLPAKPEQTEAGRPPASRIQTLAYDKAADDGEVHAMLARVGIAPVIQNRSLWKDEFERMLPGHTGTSNIVHDEAGTVYCYDRTNDPPVRHRMAYNGYEQSRGTVKYRCPSRHEQWEKPCPYDRVCNAGRAYGKTVRVKCEIDLRRFPQVPRATKQFERLYKGRTAVERVNARLKVFWGADDGNVVGAARFHAKIGVVMLVHIALATLLARAPRWTGVLGQTRLSPIAKALHAAPT